MAMDREFTFANKLVVVVSDLETETQNLAMSKIAWVTPSIQAFSILKKTEGGADPVPEFLAGFVVS